MQLKSFVLPCLLAAILALAMIFAGCEGEKGPAGPPGTNPQGPPIITAVVAMPDSVGTGEVSTFLVSAYDPNGDPMTYSWTSTAGTLLTPAAASTRWTAPSTMGLVTILVSVHDANSTTTDTLLVGVNTYVPAVIPNYLGNDAVSCGHCHNGYQALWSGTPHANPDTLIPVSHRTTGYDTSIDNGGYDDNPCAELDHVQCEACHGPQGPDVGNHQNLLAGYQGESCGHCHIQNTEYQYSAHGTAIERSGGLADFMAEWQGANCRGCHISEGFLINKDSHWAGRSMPAEGNQVTCGTCHDPHMTSSDNPQQLRALGDPFNLPYGGEENPGAYEITGWGKGQLCGQCHHSRRDRTSIMGQIDNGTNHPGPHASPQADMISGRGAYEIPGLTYDRGNQHADFMAEGGALENYCVSCHMRATDAPYEHTVHSFNPDVVSCNGCHGSPTNFDINGKQTEIEGMLEELALLLPHDADGNVIEDTRTEGWTRELREAGYAYFFVESDASRGVHNYTYTHSLLQNAIDYLTPGPNRAPVNPPAYTWAR